MMNDEKTTLLVNEKKLVELFAELVAARETIAALREKHRWIPVSERLPPVDVEVLMRWTTGQHVASSLWEEGDELLVSHWQYIHPPETEEIKK